MPMPRVASIYNGARARPLSLLSGNPRHVRGPAHLDTAPPRTAFWCACAAGQAKSKGNQCTPVIIPLSMRLFAPVVASSSFHQVSCVLSLDCLLACWFYAHAHIHATLDRLIPPSSRLWPARHGTRQTWPQCVFVCARVCRMHMHSLAASRTHTHTHTTATASPTLPCRPPNLLCPPSLACYLLPSTHALTATARPRTSKHSKARQHATAQHRESRMRGRRRHEGKGRRTSRRLRHGNATPWTPPPSPPSPPPPPLHPPTPRPCCGSALCWRLLLLTPCSCCCSCLLLLLVTLARPPPSPSPLPWPGQASPPHQPASQPRPASCLRLLPLASPLAAAVALSALQPLQPLVAPRALGRPAPRVVGVACRAE